jgi:hypothetical protein
MSKRERIEEERKLKKLKLEKKPPNDNNDCFIPKNKVKKEKKLFGMYIYI